MIPLFRKITVFLLVVFAINDGLEAQNFIGLSKDQVADAVKQYYPNFKQDRNAINHTYKYLKYVDKISEQTILFFLSDKDVCTYVRWMSDYSNINDMIALLNKNYKKSGNNTWTYTDKGQDYIIKLDEDQWYFTVSFREK